MKLRSLFVALVIGITLPALSAEAQSRCGCGPTCCDPCWDRCDWCGNFEIGGHALYWKPMVCSWSYGAFARGNNVDVQSLKPEYSWGFRVFGLYTRDCFFANLSYTWLQTRDSSPRQSALNVNGFGTLVNQLNGATANLNYDYQNVDLRLGQFIYKSCGCHFNLFGNVRWVDIEERRELRGDNRLTGDIGPASLEYKAEFNGVGLGVGTSGEYGIWCNFGAFGQLNFMAIIGDRSNPENLVRTSANAARVDYKSNTCIVPAAELRFGLDYTWTCNCLTTVWEVGYETNYYWNALEQANQADDARSRECIDIGFGGLFFGGRVLF